MGQLVEFELKLKGISPSPLLKSVDMKKEQVSCSSSIDRHDSVSTSGSSVSCSSSPSSSPPIVVGPSDPMMITDD